MSPRLLNVPQRRIIRWWDVRPDDVVSPLARDEVAGENIWTPFFLFLDHEETMLLTPEQGDPTFVSVFRVRGKHQISRAMPRVNSPIELRFLQYPQIHVDVPHCS